MSRLLLLFNFRYRLFANLPPINLAQRVIQRKKRVKKNQQEAVTISLSQMVSLTLIPQIISSSFDFILIFTCTTNHAISFRVWADALAYVTSP